MFNENEYKETGVFCRTLFIGAGGVGCKIVRRIKKRLLERYGENQLIKFLFVDTDAATFQSVPDMPEISPTERCHLAVPDADRIISEVESGSALRKDIQSWIMKDLLMKHKPALRRLGRLTGASTIRAVGKFAIHAAFPALYGTLENVREELTRLDAELVEKFTRVKDRFTFSNRYAIYLVFSSSGGTGSGSFFDIALLLRYVFRGIPLDLWGVVVLPSALSNWFTNKQEQRKRIEANAFATLKEIEYFMDEEATQEGWQFEYPGNLLVNLDKPIFEKCFLVEGYNSQGKKLSSPEDVFELVAQTLTKDTGSPIGATIASREIDDDALADVFPCPQTNRRRNFSSFSSCSLIIPVNEILKYCQVKLGREFVRERFLGLLPGSKELENEIGSFLTANQLEERGKINQVLDALLLDKNTNTLITYADYGLEANALSLPKEKFLELLQAKEIDFTSIGLPEIESIVTANAVEKGEKAKEVISKKLGNLLRNKGILHTLSFLEALISAFSVMRNEMILESKEWKEEIKTCYESDDSNSYQQKIVQLKSYGSLIDIIFRAKLDENLKIDILTLFNRKIEQEILDKARQQALKFFEKIITLLTNLLEKVKGIRETLQCLQLRLDNQMNELLMQFGKPLSGFVLGISVVDKDFYEKIYEQFRPSQEDLMARIENYWNRSENIEDIINYICATEPKQLEFDILKECYPFFMQGLLSKDIVQVILEEEGKGGGKGELIKVKLSELFDLSLPFWRVYPPGGLKFFETLVIGVPSTTNTGIATLVDETVDRWIEENTIDDPQYIRRPQKVHTGYPMALDIVRRTHGARLYYLQEYPILKGSFSEMSKIFPLHIHKDFQLRIPLIEPEKSLVAKRLFALALAYGYIVKRAERYYYAVAEGKNEAGLPLPKYNSDWTTISKLNPELGVKPEKARTTFDTIDLLSQGRSEAMQKFCLNQNYINELEDVMRKYEEEAGKGRIVKELNLYIREVLDKEIDKKTSLKEQYELEKLLIADRIKRLEES